MRRRLLLLLMMMSVLGADGVVEVEEGAVEECVAFLLFLLLCWRERGCSGGGG